MTLLTLDFVVHPTTMAHPVIVGGCPGELDIQPTMLIVFMKLLKDITAHEIPIRIMNLP